MFRGNAAPLGQELRENLHVEIYSVAIGASSEQLASLQRVIGGPKLAAERMLQLDSVDELSDPSKLAFLRRSLCSSMESGMTTQEWKH